MVETPGKRAGRWSLLHAGIATVAACGVGFFAGSVSASKAPQRFTQLHAAQRDHARVMFCYAPAERSLRVIRGYLTEAKATEDQRTPFGVELLAQVAVLEERSRSPGAEEAWARAEESCRASGTAACGRESLRSLAEATCGEAR